MKTAYIVKAYRTAVGKAPRGLFRFKRPDELAAETIEYMMKELPQLDKKRIDDVIVGNAMPEAEQGLNVARLISLMGLKVEDVQVLPSIVTVPLALKLLLLPLQKSKVGWLTVL